MEPSNESDLIESSSKSYESCIDLGVMQVHGCTAQLYACERLLIARFIDPPGETRAQHMHKLTFESDVFLLAAFRLYLDHVGAAPLPNGLGQDDPLES